MLKSKKKKKKKKTKKKQSDFNVFKTFVEDSL